MRAIVLFRDCHVAGRDRQGPIIEVRGDGVPPYLARWEDRHQSAFVSASGAGAPSSSARIIVTAERRAGHDGT
jgi:Domain of unknown function (DUF1918)